MSAFSFSCQIRTIFDRHFFRTVVLKKIKMSTTVQSTSTSKQGNVAEPPKPETPIIVTLTGDEDSEERNRTFVFNNEGHTLGNALRCILSQYSTVEFCGYTVPHPAEFKMNLRIQTNGPPAIDVLKQALRDLSQMCDHTLEVFSTKTAEFKGIDEAASTER